MFLFVEVKKIWLNMSALVVHKIKTLMLTKGKIIPQYFGRLSYWETYNLSRHIINNIVFKKSLFAIWQVGYKFWAVL